MLRVCNDVINSINTPLLTVYQRTTSGCCGLLAGANVSLQLIARASEHCVIRSSPCNATKQCILTILLDCMVLFTPDYLVNLVKRLRVHVKVIMKLSTQLRMFKRTCNPL